MGKDDAATDDDSDRNLVEKQYTVVLEVENHGYGGRME